MATRAAANTADAIALPNKPTAGVIVVPVEYSNIANGNCQPPAPSGPIYENRTCNSLVFNPNRRSLQETLPLPTKDAIVYITTLAAVLTAVPLPARAQGPERPGFPPDCTPACRPGFVCAARQCISACNPPCPANQMCTANADCVPIAPSAPTSGPGPNPQSDPQYPQPYPAQGPYSPPGGYYAYPYYPMPPAEGPLPPPAPDVPRPGDRNHDGLFLRLGLGLGGRIGTMSTAVALFQFELGYTVAKNVVLAGGWYGADGLHHESFTIAGRSVDTGTNAVNILGGTVVFYPDPHKGLHLELLAGLAAIVVNSSETGLSSSHTGLGFGGGGGGGYEWWISSNWSLGVLGRITYAQARIPLGGEGLGANGVDAHLISIGAAFAATYH